MIYKTPKSQKESGRITTEEDTSVHDVVFEICSWSPSISKTKNSMS